MFGWLKTLFNIKYAVNIKLIQMEDRPQFRVQYEIVRIRTIYPPYAPSPREVRKIIKAGHCFRTQRPTDCWYALGEAQAFIEGMGDRYNCKPHIKKVTWYKPAPPPTWKQAVAKAKKEADKTEELKKFLEPGGEADKEAAALDAILERTKVENRLAKETRKIYDALPTEKQKLEFLHVVEVALASGSPTEDDLDRLHYLENVGKARIEEEAFQKWRAEELKREEDKWIKFELEAANKMLKESIVELQRIEKQGNVTKAVDRLTEAFVAAGKVAPKLDIPAPPAPPIPPPIRVVYEGVDLPPKHKGVSYGEIAEVKVVRATLWKGIPGVLVLNEEDTLRLGMGQPYAVWNTDTMQWEWPKVVTGNHSTTLEGTYFTWKGVNHLPDTTTEV